MLKTEKHVLPEKILVAYIVSQCAIQWYLSLPQTNLGKFTKKCFPVKCKTTKPEDLPIKTLLFDTRWKNPKH